MSEFVDALNQSGIECLEYEKKPDVIGVREEGTCIYKGVEIQLDLLADSELTKGFVNLLKGIGGYWISSNNWTIVVQDEKLARELQEKLGVKVQ